MTEPAGWTQPQPRRQRPRVDAGRLWAGGATAAVVVAGVAVIGFLITRGILDIRVLTPRGEDRLFDSAMAWFAIASALATLVATAIAHILIVAVPEPIRFFSWIVGVATLIAALLPFLGDAQLPAKIATAAIALSVGIAIVALVGRVARASYTYA
jgi:Family of unknown function (DUF6069)